MHRPFKMRGRRIGVRKISPKEILILSLFVTIISKRAEGMAGFSLGLSQDTNDDGNFGFFYSPLGGTSMTFPMQPENEKTIMEDVSLYFS